MNPRPDAVGAQFQGTLVASREVRLPDVMPTVLAHAPETRAFLGILRAEIGPVRLVFVVSQEGSNGPAPGAEVTAHPREILDAAPVVYGRTPGWRSDEHVCRFCNHCNTRGGDARSQVTVFMPLPAAIRPQVEAARPQAPTAEQDTKHHAGLDRPQERRGVSMKGQSEKAQPGIKERPAERAAAPLPRDADASVARVHERYIDLRAELAGRTQERAASEMAALTDLGARPTSSDSAPALAPRETNDPPKNAIEQKILEQLTRLDSAAREYFARPGWQREAAFQRAMMLALFASGTPLSVAQQELAGLFSGRMNLDLDQLGKLAQSYGLADAQAMSDAKGDPKAPADAQREAADRAALRDKQKQGRLPEEMLLAQNAVAAATGGKKKLKGTLDRVEGVDQERRGEEEADEEESADEEAALLADQADSEQARPHRPTSQRNS